MQLKKIKNIRGRLALATCTVLHGAAHAVQPTTDQWDVQSAILYYSEQDRVDVLEPAVISTKALDDNNTISWRGVLDTMSGATPNGAVPSDQPQTYTSASGNSYTVPAGAYQTMSFEDTRAALGVDWTHNLSRLNTRTLTADISKETDYFSLGGSATYTFDTENRMTTYATGFGLNYDLVSPTGGAPPEFGIVPDTVSGGDDGGEGGEGEGEGDEGLGLNGEQKITASVLLGITQTISRRALTQLNYTYTRNDGYLTDPYKLLSVVDNNGETLNHIYEKRPDSRNGNALYWAFVYHLPRDVLHLSYRYYWDDWAIQSNTYDLKYRFELGGGHYLQPSLRYYTQTAADFYHLYLLDGEPLPNFASADYRLADMQSTIVGIKYGVPVSKSGEFSMRAEYMAQTGDYNSNDAIGVLKQYDLYPDLTAAILQINFSTKF